MFTQSARFYDALYGFKDYRRAADQLHSLIVQRAPNARTVLDVGCGTGRHAERLREFYAVDGLDLNDELLDVARERCPDCTWHLGDMASFELGRTFDVVTCLFSAIGYVKTVDRLDAAITCMARHVAPGGLLFIEPWFSPSNYWVGVVTMNVVDQPDMKIAWMYRSDIDGALSILDIQYLVGTAAGVEHLTERHELGLFTHDEHARAFDRAGLRVGHDPQGLFGRGMYTGWRDETRTR